MFLARERQADGTFKYDHYLSNAPPDTPLKELARVAKAAHRIEECFRRAKSEAGLGDDLVRNWMAWHHHMTRSLVSLWFLCLERQRAGEKAPAITVPQMRQVFTRLLRHPALSPETIAEHVERVLRRNEESRIYHGHKATGTFPPRRPRPNTI